MAATFNNVFNWNLFYFTQKKKSIFFKNNVRLSHCKPSVQKLKKPCQAVVRKTGRPCLNSQWNQSDNRLCYVHHVNPTSIMPQKECDGLIKKGIMYEFCTNKTINHRYCNLHKNFLSSNFFITFYEFFFKWKVFRLINFKNGILWVISLQHLKISTKNYLQFILSLITSILNQSNLLDINENSFLDTRKYAWLIEPSGQSFLLNKSISSLPSWILSNIISPNKVIYTNAWWLKLLISEIIKKFGIHFTVYRKKWPIIFSLLYNPKLHIEHFLNLDLNLDFLIEINPELKFKSITFFDLLDVLFFFGTSKLAKIKKINNKLWIFLLKLTKEINQLKNYLYDKKNDYKSIFDGLNLNKNFINAKKLYLKQKIFLNALLDQLWWDFFTYLSSRHPSFGVSFLLKGRFMVPSLFTNENRVWWSDSAFVFFQNSVICSFYFYESHEIKFLQYSNWSYSIKKNDFNLKHFLLMEQNYRVLRQKLVKPSKKKIELSSFNNNWTKINNNKKWLKLIKKIYPLLKKNQIQDESELNFIKTFLKNAKIDYGNNKKTNLFTKKYVWLFSNLLN